MVNRGWLTEVHFCLLLVLLSGCGFYHEKPLPEAGGFSRSTLPSYKTVSERVFGPRCISCHGSRGGVNLQTYTATRGNLAKIETAVLLKRTMPPQAQLSREEFQLLSDWIKGGAPELSPEELPVGPPPAPLKPSFQSIRSHILVPRCLTCHSAEGEAREIPLSTLSDLVQSPREIVLPGSPDDSGMVIALERQDSKRMPPPESGGALSAEEIKVIRQWIEEGAH